MRRADKARLVGHMTAARVHDNGTALGVLGAIVGAFTHGLAGFLAGAAVALAFRLTRPGPTGELDRATGRDKPPDD